MISYGKMRGTFVLTGANQYDQGTQSPHKRMDKLPQSQSCIEAIFQFIGFRLFQALQVHDMPAQTEPSWN